MCSDTYWVEGAKMTGIYTLSICGLGAVVLATITCFGDTG